MFLLSRWEGFLTVVCVLGRAYYAINPRPDALMKEELVRITRLSPRVVRVWYQNKRFKEKRKLGLERRMQREQVWNHALRFNSTLLFNNTRTLFGSSFFRFISKTLYIWSICSACRHRCRVDVSMSIKDNNFHSLTKSISTSKCFSIRSSKEKCDILSHGSILFECSRCEMIYFHLKLSFKLVLLFLLLQHWLHYYLLFILAWNKIFFIFTREVFGMTNYVSVSLVVWFAINDNGAECRRRRGWARKRLLGWSL